MIVQSAQKRYHEIKKFCAKQRNTKKSIDIMIIKVYNNIQKRLRDT